MGVGVGWNPVQCGGFRVLGLGYRGSGLGGFGDGLGGNQGVFNLQILVHPQITQRGQGRNQSWLMEMAFRMR